MQYEIHVTVRDADIARFRKFCTDATAEGYVPIKPIILHLQDRHGTKVMRDVMTSSKTRAANDKLAGDTALTHVQLLRNAGFMPVRYKIEAPPHHPLAPTKTNGGGMPSQCYFEAHLQCVRDPHPRQDSHLAGIAKRHGAHLSRNAYKRTGSASAIFMMTLRSRLGADTTVEEFKASVSALHFDLGPFAVRNKKPEIEFCVYDSNTSHDDPWIKA